MQNLHPSQIQIIALTTGKSAVFRDVVTGEQFYASRRVTNDILNAQIYQEDIVISVQKPQVPMNEDRPLKPYERMSWLATPSRF